MLIKDLMPGMLLRPKDGFVWQPQHVAYLDKLMCVTVMPARDNEREDRVVMYMGERQSGSMTYGKQIILWDGSRVSVNPAAWRCIIPVE